MAANIIDVKDKQSILARLELLSETSARAWGTMTAAEMLWHCRQQLEFVVSPPPHVKIISGPLRYQPFKWLVIFVIPWPKGSATAPTMNPKKMNPLLGSFAEEKQQLLTQLEKVLELPAIQATHPLFGTMGKHYWGRVIWKHLDHHLRQFNC